MNSAPRLNKQHGAGLPVMKLGSQRSLAMDSAAAGGSLDVRDRRQLLRKHNEVQENSEGYLCGIREVTNEHSEFLTEIKNK